MPQKTNNTAIAIFIKSYNRPYYLERCLLSLEKHILDTNYQITIIDDGTPAIFLEEIKQRYPKVKLLKTPFYPQKAPNCQKGIAPENTQIPIHSWLEATKNSPSEYFMLLEEDIWLTHDIALSKIVNRLKTENGWFLKAFWLGNPAIIQAQKQEHFQEGIIAVTPDLYTWNPFLYQLIFHKFDRFKIRKTFKALKIHTRKRDLSYYSLYSVAGNIFKKDYFLALWENHKNIVDEKLQLYNALKFIRKKKPSSKEHLFFRTKTEVMRTGFCSAASQPRRFKIAQYPDWMFQINKALNEAWLLDDLDVLQGFPKDYSEEYLIDILKQQKLCEEIIQNWQKWRNGFLEEFASIGCQTLH